MTFRNISCFIDKLLVDTNNQFRTSKYLLTACCKVLLEKRTGLQLVKKFPCVSRNPKVHYSIHNRPPPVSILGQPNPVHKPTSHRSILILSTHVRLGLPSGLFLSGFPTKTLYTPSPHPYAPHAQPISFFSILDMQSLILCRQI